VRYDNIAAFAQATATTLVVDATAGARFEHHSQFGDSVVPRVALTREFDPFHAKALASYAFRAPGIENLNLNPDVMPERTRVIELEAGWRMTRDAMLSANVFDIRIDDPIVYYWDEVNEVEGYANYERTGTRGFEIDWRLDTRRLFLDVNYSFYSAAGNNRVADYAVPGHDNELLGFAPHKVAWNARLWIWRGLRFNPSGSYLSPRHGYLRAPASGDPVVERADGELLVDMMLSWDDLLVRGLRLAGGVHNLLDENTVFIQPYAQGHAPLPGSSREWMVHATYEIDL
jgi:outer membrane cobalamin receptor